MTTFTGSSSNDTLFGSANDDVLFGLGGVDELTGHAGADVLYGGDQDDSFVGGAGNDTLDGGAGVDQILYYREIGTRGVMVDLQAGWAIDTYGNTDTLIGIERIYGSTLGDTILGRDAVGDLLFGRGGNDSLNGGGADDTLIGDAGNDTLNGGAGNDQVAYFLDIATSGVSVNLQTGLAVDGAGNIDTLISIETVLGSNFADTLVGRDSAADLLFGRDGADSLNGGAFDDTLIGDAGNDTLNGGAGNDQVAYSLETGGRGISLDLQAGSVIDSWGHTDTLISIEYVFGTAANDTLLGSNRDGDRLFGGAGDDVIDGRDGNNLIYTGAGNDQIHVGTSAPGARDTVVISGFGNKLITGTGSAGTRYGHHLVFEVDEAVTVNLATGLAQSARMTTDFSQARFFLEVGGTAHGDLLIGGNPAHGYLEWFCGNQGNDTINGGGGAGDTVVYDDEVLYGSYNFALGRHEYGNRGVVVDLASGIATDSFGGTDRLIDIDDVRATRFADHLTGNAGDNAFWGLAGADTLNGAAGQDSAFYGEDYVTGGTAGIIANLATGSVRDGFGSMDVLIGIENLYATNFADALTGDAAANRLFAYDGADAISAAAGNDTVLAGGGADTVSGGDGDDELWGEAGADTLDGGAGLDVVRYLSSTGGVTVDLAAGAAVDGFGSVDTLIGIEQAHGSAFNDTLRGDAAANQLQGLEGADSLNGAAGNDSLIGGAGADTLQGSDGDDELWGEAGADTLDGGAGQDAVRYLSSISGVTVDLAAGAAVDGFGSVDTLIGIEQAHGSAFNDTLRGDAAANRLYGLDGADSLNGAAGNDTLLGGAGADTISGGDGEDEIWGEAGADTLDGGAGLDVVRYLSSTSGVTVDLAAGAAVDGFGSVDTLIGIEQAHGSAFNDTLRGDAAANRLYGLDGADSLNGAAGNDTLLGGAGADTISGGDGEDEIWGEAGADTLDGGAGLDVVRYTTATAAVLVDLASGFAQDGFGSTDQLSGFEQVHGSAFSDTLRGDAFDNRLSGFDGDDLLSGGAGNDLLLGGTGNDSLSGGDGDDELLGEAGADTIDGGVGTDTVRFFNALVGVSIDLTLGTAQESGGPADVLISIESAHGSNFNDALRGNSAANRLFGLDGDDVFFAGRGADTLSGGNGADRYEIMAGDGFDSIVDLGQGGGDRVVFNSYLAENASIYRQSLQNDNIVFDFGTPPGLTADAVVLANTLTAGAVGAIEWFQFADGTVWDHATMLAHLGQQRVQATWQFSTGADVAMGSLAADMLDGLAGDDVISGLEGADILRGDVGHDTLRGGEGGDTLNGGAGNDSLSGGDSFADLRDVIYGGDGDDRIDGGYGNDQGFGGLGNDVLDGGFGADELYGQEGDDTLTGGAFSDVIFGGDGNDLVNGGFGHDRLNGGLGADRFFHLGIRDHGSDWVQDYSAAQGDVLATGIAGAQRSDFAVSFATGAGIGQAGVQEAYVTYLPSGQILWALVDGAAQGQINLMIGGQTFDLLH